MTVEKDELVDPTAETADDPATGTTAAETADDNANGTPAEATAEKTEEAVADTVPPVDLTGEKTVAVETEPAVKPETVKMKKGGIIRLVPKWKVAEFQADGYKVI